MTIGFVLNIPVGKTQIVALHPSDPEEDYWVGDYDKREMALAIVVEHNKQAKSINSTVVYHAYNDKRKMVCSCEHTRQANPPRNIPPSPPA